MRRGATAAASAAAHRRHWERSHYVPGATVPSRTHSWGWLQAKATWKLVEGKRDRSGGNDALP